MFNFLGALLTTCLIFWGPKSQRMGVLGLVGTALTGSEVSGKTVCCWNGVCGQLGPHCIFLVGLGTALESNNLIISGSSMSGHQGNSWGGPLHTK